MTRIPSKAPPIQQLPIRERPSSEAAGKHFNEVLNAKPVVEPRPDARSPQHVAQIPDRDLISSQAPPPHGWDLSLSRPGPHKSLADAATAVYSPASAPGRPATASTSRQLDWTQSLVRPDHEATLVDAGHAAYPPAPVTERPAMALPDVPVAQPVSPLPSTAGTVVEPPVAVQGKGNVVVLVEDAVATSPYAEDVSPETASLNPSALGTTDRAAPRQAMPSDVEGTWLPRVDRRGDETTSAVPIGQACELPAPCEESPSAFMLCEPAALVQEILTPEGGGVPEPYPMAVQSQAQASPPSVEASLVPEAASQRTQAPVQLQTRMGPDKQDWIIRPWRLQANAGLSFRSNGVATTGALGGASLMTGSVSHGVQSRMALSGMDSSEGGALPARWKSVLRLPVQLESASGRMEADGINASDSVEAKGGQLAALVHWSQRMLRWSGSAAGAGGITAWVRDYALATSDVPALIESLVALSTEQGFSLARIVVNGHEAWSAGEQHMTRGNQDGR